MRVWRALWLIGHFGFLVHGSHHKHDHHNAIHKKLHEEHKREVSSSIAGVDQAAATGSISTSHDDSDAAAAVARALKVLGGAVDQAESTELLLTRRDTNSTIGYGYLVPFELKEAARAVAELNPPSPSTGNYSAMRAKYGDKTKDTLTPAQMLRAYDGLSGSGTLETRESSTWWMATMTQRGSSPFAPSGYKVMESLMTPYYNTQLIGDPLELPTILAVSSFVGLGVITSDVYIGDQEEWYINTNNFLRSVRNFKINITRTDQGAYVWTSLENLKIYMTQDVSTTQQGIYMENGSGGFISDLTFVGGNFGAYLRNQQFTTSYLAWTIQDVVIESCRTGVVIVGGARGPFSTSQGVGSFVLVDAIIANTPTGITTTLYGENSTALLLQNVGFYNTQNAIYDQGAGKALIPGGDQTILDSWGFGMVSDPSGSRFVSGNNLLAINRTSSLVGTNKYNVLDVKALGAKGDGVTDDTTVLNSILSRGSNMSSIIYFPHSIMATGPKFQDLENPYVAVRVGQQGDIGIVEIQDILFTVSGPTAGAVLMEWNIAYYTLLYVDSHFRIGGAIGSGLQAADCLKESGTVNKRCIAAALVLRLTQSSSAYLENVWGLTWLYGTSSKHHALYQYQFYNAKNVVMDRAFEIEESYDVWIYNLVSKAIREMVSPRGEMLTYATDNKNGFLSSLLAWIRGPKEIISSRDHAGFHVWDSDTDSEALAGLPSACKTSLTQLVRCDIWASTFLGELYRGSLYNDTLTDSVCDESCGESLKSWFDSVATDCAGYNVSSSTPTKYGGQIWSGWNETCLKDPTTDEYCNDIIEGFSEVDFTKDRPKSELCSFCYVERLEMMQRSSYSVYDEYFQADLVVVHARCDISGPTEMPPSLDAPLEFHPEPACLSGKRYITVDGDICDSVALHLNVSSASFVMANNRYTMVCDRLPSDMDLCVPTTCASTYVLKDTDTCRSIEEANGNDVGDSTTPSFGHVICLRDSDESYTATAPIPGVTISPGRSSGYLRTVIDPPSNATVANGTTLKCGKWHVAKEGESCPMICLGESITSTLFLAVNPSLSSSNCSLALVTGNAYCAGPTTNWASLSEE
ncbi:Glucan 1,3-beta-glucosidase [Penicillium rolfsii]|nr:Glucan 1,3-beta-glucosidase [Penicillium rolfsii]